MNVFDIIGPVMIGPSSSHTAGAARLGKMAWTLLGEAPVKIDIRLSGSFAQTGKGHGTEKAITAGCMGMDSADDRIRDALELARERGIECSVSCEDLPGAHPNTAVISLVGGSGKTTRIIGCSVGGGNIMIQNVDGLEVEFSGQNFTVLVRHTDRPGVIAAVTEYLSESDVNICNFRLSRKGKGKEALMMIECDSTPPKHLLDGLRALPNVTDVIFVGKV